MTNLEVAKNVILAYLEKHYSTVNAVEIMALKENNDVLKEHVKALKNVFEDALKELEVIGNENKDN